MKTAVYSLRLSPGLKADLERVARNKKTRLSNILEMAIRDWLSKNAEDVSSDEEQKRLHASIAPLLGSIKGSDTRRSENASPLIKKSLRRRYGR